jgi:hypothetical protein
MSVNTLTPNGLIRELAIRHNSDGYVALYWNSETEEITLRVVQGSDDFSIRDIPPTSALDAWNHPYAFADHALKTGRMDYSHAA